MNRQMRRVAHKLGRKRQAKEWNDFVNITDGAQERHELVGGSSTFNPKRIFINNKYSVFVFYPIFREAKIYTKVLVRRSDAEPIYSWNDLYRIKNEIFGEEIEAVQFMPKVSELTDVANIYWFFIEDAYCAEAHRSMDEIPCGELE